MGTPIQRLTALEKSLKSEIRAPDPARVTEHISDSYISLYKDIKANRHRFYNLTGGRGSGKSSFISLVIVNGIMEDPTGTHNAVVFRRNASTLRDSVLSQIVWAINKLNAWDQWKINIAPMRCIYKPTGAQILFKGLDDPAKLKSIKPKKGFFKYIWFEEVSELQGENHLRNVMQSVARAGDGIITFRSMNPPLSKSNWANIMIARSDGETMTSHTTYLDIPSSWLGSVFIAEADKLKRINPIAYQYEYMGDPTGSGGEVFPNIITAEITNKEAEEMQYIYNGLDFGFASDPLAFVQVGYNAKTGTIYALKEIYKRNLLNADLIKELSFIRDNTVICDNAEPKSIAELKQNGIRAKPCRKYAGCVKDRIKWLQSQRIIIDPNRTPNIYREFTSYEYTKTKDGDLLAEVPDKDNHTIDATGYALDRIIYKNKPTHINLYPQGI